MERKHLRALGFIWISQGQREQIQGSLVQGTKSCHRNISLEFGDILQNKTPVCQFCQFLSGKYATSFSFLCPPTQNTLFLLLIEATNRYFKTWFFLRCFGSLLSFIFQKLVHILCSYHLGMASSYYIIGCDVFSYFSPVDLFRIPCK